MGAITDAILLGADTYDAQSSFDPEVRKKYMNASEAMSCIRRQWYEKNDADRDGPESWGFARRGSHGEKYVVERLRLANYHLVMGGDEQESIVDEETRISATPDGFLWAPSITGLDKKGWIALEIKTIDPRVKVADLPRDGHVRQVQICAEIAGKNGLPDAYPVIGCKIIYMDASNFNKLHEYDVPLKPGILEQLAPRARRILQSPDAARLPREGTHSAGKKDCKLCPFTKICGVDGVEKRTEAPKSTSMTSLRTQYVSAKADEAEAGSRKAKAAEDIKAELERLDQTSMDVDEGSVRLTKKAGTVSWKKVAEDHCSGVDLEPYRGNPSTTLTVK